ncbi:ornithine cyclodeaminase family protein [Nakamurella sp. YIM 132087]|uniref:Ornithine cyclodeaminase family protein n=1 Tax=Nakamurella alba TaxID=2665158 RepID=A0A7K1FJ59_9ACTN|nr:ornithine cyclodeaminase family protein [Nakamurella alba]MTD14157.1 ornithine cyclodeaminase family protein [Nakamurella alba]
MSSHLALPVQAGLPHITADEVFATVAPREAVAMLQTALRDGLQPTDDPDRGLVEFRSGQLLLMPTEFGDRAGVKLALVAPGNAGRGLDLIQGVYVLLDADTFVPLATMDGPALTALRTPAVTVAALEPLLAQQDSPLQVAIVGRGLQGRGHAVCLADTLAGVRPIASVAFLGRRDHDGGTRLDEGLDAGTAVTAPRLGTPEGDRALAAADLVICATTATSPVFDSALLRDDVVAAAMGSHEPRKRELDGALFARAHVVVEDPATALREAGDVIQAVEEGCLDPARLVTMADVVTGRAQLSRDRPVVFKGTGMSWQDLVVGDAVHRRWLQGRAADAAAG